MSAEMLIFIVGGVVIGQVALFVGGPVAALATLAALLWGGWVLPRLVDRESRR